AGRVELFRHRTAGAEGDRRGTIDRPGIGAGPERLAAFPRALRGSLAAGMGELDADLRRRGHRAHVGEYGSKRRLVLVAVETEAAVGDAAAALDRGRFEDHQADAGERERAEMDAVPGLRRAVDSAVLAHRGDDDPIRKVEPGDARRRKQRTGHEG